MPPENVAAVVSSMSAILRSRPFISFSSRWILSASSASNSSGIAEATGPPGLTAGSGSSAGFTGPVFLGFPGFSGFMVGSVMVFSPDWSSIRRFQLPNGRRIHVQFGGDLTRLRPTGRDRDHRLASQLLGYWPVAQPVLAGGEPVDPRGQQRLALRITQTPHHACHVTSVRETVIDRRAFLPIRVTKPMRATLDGSPVVRSRPGPGTMPSATVPTGIRAHESRPWN